MLQAGCVGGKRTGSKEEVSKEEGKRGSWWVAKEFELVCFLLLRCLDAG